MTTSPRAVVPHRHHPVALGAPRGWGGGGAAPLVLQREDTDVVDRLLAELRTADGRQRLLGSRAHHRNEQQVLTLFQPIHRRHHPVVLEAWCDIPGAPRLDPARIESAGLVVRRQRGTGLEAWARSRDGSRGWWALSRLPHDGAEPDAERRQARSVSGVATIDSALRALAVAEPDAWLSEVHTPLFVAPPSVGDATGRTVLYGLLPTTSAERSEAAPAFDPDGTFGPSSPDFVGHLTGALRGDAMPLPLPGASLDARWVAVVESDRPAPPAGLAAGDWAALGPGGPGRASLQRLLRLLRQLHAEFDVFALPASAPSDAPGRALRAELAAWVLPQVGAAGRPARQTDAWTFLQGAWRVLIEQRGGEAVEMPATWPALAADRVGPWREALWRSLAERFARLQGGEARFEAPQARYVVQAFVRLKAEAGCPARVVWTPPGEPFVIAPWYAGAGAPPVRVPLPDFSDPARLRTLQPGVAFAVPAPLQHLLSGSPKDLMDGKPPPGAGLDIAWICSFNIPVITLCAFIVLNIFLSLLDIIFRWLAFIKICLPLPGRREP